MRGQRKVRGRAYQHLRLLPAALAGGLLLLSGAALAKDYAAARERMVAQVADRGISDAKTLAAMRAIPRERFVPHRLRPFAYSRRPLPIGHGQTISAPDIVALMTQVLGLEPDDRVLEIGTGSGYQAAVLSLIVAQVSTIEIIAPLGEAARTRLDSLGYTNIVTRIGDGYYGWPDAPPFDAIIVTCAASHIPPPLIEQLRPSARMIIPVGSVMQVQHLLLLEKDAAGKVTQRSILPVRFVPLTGGPRARP